MATWGVPAGSPAPLIGWHTTRRQPSKLECLRVETTLPSTRARSIGRGEIRDPKSEIRKKSECRSPNARRRLRRHFRNSEFGIRISFGLRVSGFGLLSDFGFRVS